MESKSLKKITVTSDKPPSVSWIFSNDMASFKSSDKQLDLTQSPGEDAEETK